MRWTPDNELTLLRTIFDTQNLHIDIDKIAEFWPGEEKPTPKALEQQLYKYRKNPKCENTVTFSKGRRSGESNDGTPRKKRATRKTLQKDVVKEEGTADA
ncbi:hypothetical protein EYZ11_002831 [Aspergillus tanneri]|uniref:Uncharacterized protein n=1 Tax=Aspergillus tanneri TaxID=1220188 RepID=A0A4S3JRV2_9EURO|nr:uncharacterized protein ATNIH1004_008479 [Aspergillus tanneri]KAA8644279.1 hypothetical protein ATNIH1004_008479 [Aspergillus tanneri]THC97668.1 hypothetical protein EYZ11_002831 [Aspergillus tanneri]